MTAGPAADSLRGDPPLSQFDELKGALSTAGFDINLIAISNHP